VDDGETTDETVNENPTEDTIEEEVEPTDDTTVPEVEEANLLSLNIIIKNNNVLSE